MIPFRRSTALLALALALVACRDERKRDADEQARAAVAAANRLVRRAVVLYYEGPSGRLVAERRELELPEADPAAVHPLLDALLAGSANASVPKLFPPDTAVRGAWLLPEGTAVVDLGGPTLQEGWSAGSHEEMVAAYAVVQTLAANLEGVKRTRILVGGQVPETLAGHLDLGRPLTPLRWLVDEPVPAAPRVAPAPSK